MARPTPLVVGVLFGVALLGALAGVVSAHQIGLSRGEYQIDGGSIRTTLTFARGELAASVQGLDADRNGRLEPGEIEAAKPSLSRRIVDGLRIEGDGQACPGRLEGAQLVEEDGLTVNATYACEGAPGQLAFDLTAVLDALAEGHRHVAFTSTSRFTVEHLTFRGQATFRVFTESEKNPGRAAAPGADAIPTLLRGLTHVVLGIVHVAFLAGLVLVGDRPKSFATMCAAFVAGQAVTVALTLLRIIAVPPQVVEAAVALTVTYVGVENWFLRHPERRWRIALPFGAVHGLGFAMGFGAVPKGGVPVLSLLAYEAGIIAGVVGVAAITVPVVSFARRSLAFRDTGIKVLSAGVGLAGLVWFALAVAR